MILPLVNVGFLGADLGDQQLLTLVTSFILFQIFGLAFFAFFQKLVPATKSAVGTDTSEEGIVTDEAERQTALANTTSRRRFVIVVSSFFVLAVGAAAIGTFFRSSADNARGSLGATTLSDGTLEGEVTPTGNFYHVSKNAIDPTVNPDSWKLQIDGLVNTPISLTLNDLRAMAAQTQYHTLTCISNPVGGPYISNAKWKGVQLKALLEKAGVKAGKLSG